MALPAVFARLPLALVLLGLSLAVPGGVRAEDFEAQVLREARAHAPALEQAMRDGRQASDRGDVQGAEGHYARALALKPDFGHALRRQCGVARALGKQAEAERLCRAALAADPGPRNRSALAGVLAAGPNGASLVEARALLAEARKEAPDLDAVAVAALELYWALEDVPSIRTGLSELRRTSTLPSQLGQSLVRFAEFLDDPARPDDKDEANRLAIEAMSLAPDDPGTAMTVAQIALNVQDWTLFDQASRALERTAPQAYPTHAFAAIRHHGQSEWAAARASLAKARALGLPQAPHNDILKAIEADEPVWVRVGPMLFRLLLVWLACFAGLFVLGMLLSALTLRSARNLPREKSGRGHGANVVLRAAYGLVLVLACVFYYVSLPLVLVSVLGGGGALIYGFFMLGQIPIKLVLIIALGVLVTFYAVLRGLFVRVRDEDPGVRLDLATQPGLRSLLDEVAAKVGTRAVDAVYLTPGTQVAVFERGSMLRQLRGASERCLVLGLGVLDGMRRTELKAILAHEYGHFSNRDTAGGGLALAVRRSMLQMAHSLAEGGANHVFNPAWWFFRTFFAVFLRISQGASRLQEVLADRWAAFSYGSEPFVRGLTHVIESSARFDLLAQAALQPIATSSTPVRDFYGLLRDVTVPEADVVNAQREHMEAKSSPYDSHPAPADRIAWARLLAAPEHESDTRDVWSLFAARDELEHSMTDVINERLGLKRVELPERPAIDF